MTTLYESVTVFRADETSVEATATYDTVTRRFTIDEPGLAAEFDADSQILASMHESLGHQGSFLGRIADGVYALLALQLPLGDADWAGICGVGEWSTQDIPPTFDVPLIAIVPDITLPGKTNGVIAASAPIEVVLDTAESNGWIACDAAYVGVQLSDPDLTEEQLELMDDLADTGTLVFHLGPFTAHVTADKEAGWFRLLDEDSEWNGGCWGTAPGAIPGSYYEPQPTPAAPVPLVAPCPYGVTHFGTTPLVNQDYLVDQLADKQDVLTAGDGIQIVNNVISATGGSGGDDGVFVDSLDDLELGDEITVYASGYCTEWPVVIKTEAVLSRVMVDETEVLTFAMPAPSDSYMAGNPLIRIFFGKPYDQPSEYSGPYVGWYDDDRGEWMYGAGAEQVDFSADYQISPDEYIKMLIDVLPAGTTGFSCNPDTSDSSPCMYFAIKRKTRRAA